MPFVVDAPAIDERVLGDEAPVEYVLRVAAQKAEAVAKRRPGALILAADTTVAIDNEILGKPADEREGRAMLARLSGKAHQVFTGVALAGASQLSCVVRTVVRFKPLRDHEIAWYVATGEGSDKAGGYAIQGRAGAFVVALEGSHSNVVGLPLAETITLLEQAAYRLPWER